MPEEGGLCGGDGSSVVLDCGDGIVLEGTSPAVAPAVARRRPRSLGSRGWAEIDDGAAMGDEGSGGSVEGGKRAASRRGDGGRPTGPTVSSSTSINRRRLLGLQKRDRGRDRSMGSNSMRRSSGCCESTPERSV